MNKKIYKRVTVKSLQEMKDNGEKISMLTSYDFTSAGIVDKAGIDVILHGGGGSAFGQHASYGLTGISMIECSGPVITPIGVPLEEKDRFPGTPVPRDGTIIQSDAPGFGLEMKKEWLPDFFS